MKYVILGAVFTLCVTFWQIKKVRLYKRVDSLRKMKAFLSDIRDEIRSARKNIFDIISQDKAGLGFFKDVGINNELLYIYYLKAKEKNLLSLCLEEKDVEVFDGFFRNFGGCDIESQLRICSDALGEIDGCLQEADEKKARYGRLYSVAGISMGFFMVIMLL